MTELRIIQRQIERWYYQESEKIKAQSRIDEYQQDEKTRIYHHDLHKKKVKRSSILKLQTPEGILEGHDACAGYLEGVVAELLLNPALLDQAAQAALLEEVEPVFTEAGFGIL